MKCLICNKYFYTNDAISQHINNCLDNNSNNNYLKDYLMCEYCDNFVSKDIFDKHITKCSNELVTCPICQDKIKKKDLDNHSNCLDNNIIECPICGDKYIKSIIEEHCNNCLNNNNNNNNVNKKCPFCENIILTNYIEHINKCSSNFNNIQQCLVDEFYDSTNQKCEICNCKIDEISILDHIKKCINEFYPNMNNIPEIWDKNQKNNIMIVQLNNKCPEFKKVEKIFLKTMTYNCKIHKIERIQNKLLYYKFMEMKYLLLKKHKKNPIIKQLFHGSERSRTAFTFITSLSTSR